MKKLLAYLIVVFCIFFILFVGYVNIDAIICAYGDGPPYYGRTTIWTNGKILFLY